MAEGVNMGRISPWNKEYLQQLYHKINNYCENLTIRTFEKEGRDAATEVMSAYTMFKFPVVYVFIHYHFGKFENLGMNKNDISSYMFYLMNVKTFTQGFLEGFCEQDVFALDKTNELSKALVDICKEVLYIENNF